jgi:hypothetical protein
VAEFPSPVCGAWLTPDDLRECCDAADGRPDVELELVVQAASEYLYERSARQFRGLCSSVLRPCGEEQPCLSYTGAVAPYGGLPGMQGMEVARTEFACGCVPLHRIDLGLWPLVTVDRVTQDGVDLDPSEYRVDAWRYLVRLPGPGGENPGWPTCQRLDLPATEPGTLEVAATHGRRPPALGFLAARALSCELEKACAGQPCKLPVRTQSVVRQGVSVRTVDPGTLPAGKTGLEQVDLFLQAYNPKGLQRGAVVWSPDLRARPHRVGT